MDLGNELSSSTTHTRRNAAQAQKKALTRKAANGLPAWGLGASIPAAKKSQRKGADGFDSDSDSSSSVGEFASRPPAPAQAPAPLLPLVQERSWSCRDAAVIQDARRRLATSADAATARADKAERSGHVPAWLTGGSGPLPKVNSPAVRGFLHFMRGGGDGTSADGRESYTRGTGAGSGQAAPSEVTLLAMAGSLGVVRAQPGADMLMSPAKPRGKASLSVNQISPLGVGFKAFEALLDLARDPKLTTGEVVARHIIPATLQQRCRYCDLVNDKFLDTPTLYVVHCWQQCFLSLVEAVRQYVLQLRSNTDDVYIWLDVLCINQHTERAGSDITTLREIIQASERVVVVIDQKGTLLQRTWCLWEMWQAAQAERQDKMVALVCGWSWAELTHSYLTLDVARSAVSKEKERNMLLSELLKSIDPTALSNQLRDALLLGSKREMQRAEKLASVNPKRYGASASTYALLLGMHCRYGEAEDVMRGVLRLYDKAAAKEVGDKELAAATYQLSCILRDQGRLAEAERVLQEFVNQFRGMQEELYMDGVGELAQILTQRKFYTKAEMLARKMLEEKVKLFGLAHPQVVASMLQLANIAVSQKLYEEAENHLREVLMHVSATVQRDTPESATAYHTLSQCMFFSNRMPEARALIDKAVNLRTRMFGSDHPLTLDSRAFQCEMMIKEKRYREAEELLVMILKSRQRSYGQEHHATLTSMGQLADLLRDMRKDDEADELEKRILSVGRQLLRYTKIDKFRSLSFITLYLTQRDQLLDKAAMFLAKAFIVFKEKLGGDHELTTTTRHQLSEIIDKVKWIASNALEQAQIFRSTTQYGVAEVMFKQAYSISKLVSPEADHKPLAQGLADALFGQGKIQEAKTIMRAAGLTKKGMKQNMPASYLRWLNTRVAKYMDKEADEDGE